MFPFFQTIAVSSFAFSVTFKMDFCVLLQTINILYIMTLITVGLINHSKPLVSDWQQELTFIFQANH